MDTHSRTSIHHGDGDATFARASGPDLSQHGRVSPEDVGESRASGTGETGETKAQDRQPTPAVARVISTRIAGWSAATQAEFVRASTPGGTTVINYVPEAPRVPEGLVCPAQMHATACCATCGLCWSPAARSETIVFIQHGRFSKQKDEAA